MTKHYLERQCAFLEGGKHVQGVSLKLFCCRLSASRKCALLEAIMQEWMQNSFDHHSPVGRHGSLCWMVSWCSAINKDLPWVIADAIWAIGIKQHRVWAIQLHQTLPIDDGNGHFSSVLCSSPLSLRLVLLAVKASKNWRHLLHLPAQSTLFKPHWHNLQTIEAC